ncbi:MAG: hypothetical protein JNJ60_20105, partial [Rhodocyclaceae bacterium]|nr:hypothetical protein [Rhodocyclaceae bacterium]
MLEAEHAHFIQGGVAICLAARDAVNRPAIARGLGCKMLDDGRRVAVFLAASQAPGVLDNIAQNGAVAAVFCLPSSNRTLQLKGTDAVAVAPQPGDAERIRCYVEAFAREVEPEGFRPEAMRVFL